MNVPNLALRMAIRAVLMTAPGLAATAAYAQQSESGRQPATDQLQDMDRQFITGPMISL